MTYYVFTTYPQDPVNSQPPSNNPYYVGISSCRDEIKEICRELYPDRVVFSFHSSKRVAQNFIQELLNQTPFYTVYGEREIN
jgi:hypothetical protein